MLSEMRPSELTEWLAFYADSPFGEERADLRAAIVASTIANVNRDSKRRPQPFKPVDFMPYQHVEPETPERLSERIRASFRGFKRK